MKAKCDFIAQEWSGMIPNLKAHKYDAVIATVSFAKERKEVVDFSLPYYIDSYEVVGNKNTDFDININSNSIAVNGKSGAIKLLQEIKPDYQNMVRTNTLDKALGQLKAGTVNFAFASSVVMTRWLKNNPNFEQKQQFASNNERDRFSIITNKNMSLQKDFNKAIIQLHISGEYGRIYSKYF